MTKHRLHLLALLITELLPPADRRGVVVGAGVGHPRPRSEVMGQIGIRGIAIKGELQHLHPWQLQAITQGLHIRSDHAQILRDQRQAATTSLLQPPQDGEAGGWQPTAVLRGVITSRHAPVAGESAEVINPQQIKQLQLPFEALQPPAVAIEPMTAPAIHRRRPELASG